MRKLHGWSHSRKSARGQPQRDLGRLPLFEVGSRDSRAAAGRLWCVQWVSGSNFSLSAPIIEAGMSDLTDESRLQTLRAVFADWVRYERENCDLVRQGLPRFRMPASYTVNEMVNLQPVATQGNAAPPPMLLQRGMLRLAEALECVGGMQGQRGDRAFALEAALLLDRLQTKYPEVFKDNLLWNHRIPGQLGQIVPWGLLRALGQQGGYLYAGLEAVENTIANDPLVKKYLTQTTSAVSPNAAPTPVAVDQGSQATPTRRRRSRSASKSADVACEAAAEATPAQRRRSRSA
jgi:hypothetical protein